MTNAEARFSNSLRPLKPEGSLGRTAQDVHLDSHTAAELCERTISADFFDFFKGTTNNPNYFLETNVRPIDDFRK